MALLRALMRAVIIALAIWAGQAVIVQANHAGIWAMVTLGIGSAVLGLILTRYLIHPGGRGQEGGIQFFSTGIVVGVFYALLPKRPGMALADFVLTLGVAVVAGLTEGFVPDHVVDRKGTRKPRT